MIGFNEVFVYIFQESKDNNNNNCNNNKYIHPIEIRINIGRMNEIR